MKISFISMKQIVIHFILVNAVPAQYTFSIFLIINIGIGAIFVYFYWYSRNKVVTNTNSKIETTRY